LSFDVVVTRFAQEGRESPDALLERLLGLTPERARELSRSLPSVVVTRTSREHATVLAEQLRDQGAEVQVLQAGRSVLEANKGTKVEPRRAAVREVYAARNDERETMPRAITHRKAVALPRRDDEVAQPARVERVAVSLRELTAHSAAAQTGAAATLAQAPSPSPMPTEPLSTPSAEQVEAAARAAEALTRRAQQAAAAATVAEVERDLGSIDFARFNRPENDANAQVAKDADPFAALELGSAFGQDPLFPAEAPTEKAKPSSLVDEFDDVVNRPLDFGGPTAKPQAKPKTAHDSDIEGLFSTPLRAAPTPARPAEPRPKAAQGSTREARAPVSEDPPAQVTLIEAEPKQHSLTVKIAAALLLLCSLGVLGLVLSDGGGGTSAPTHQGSAEAKLESGDDTPDNMHVLVRLMPRGMDRSMGVVLRQLVSGTFNVQLDVEGLPNDTQCLLIKADDGQGTARLRKLLRTGARVPLSDEANAAFDEHEQSLRLAMGEGRMTFKRVCLSVDLYKESLKTGKAE
jgi:hypothetical protein